MVFKKIKQSFQNKLPFAVFKKPNSTFIKSFFQRNSNLYFTVGFSESGFVFSPFNSEEKSILIPLNQSDILEEKHISCLKYVFHNSYKEDRVQREFYIQLVNSAIRKIDETHLQKVVLSRKEEVYLEENNFLIFFEKLLAKHSNSYVYCWFHPKIGLWMGATPETLLFSEENRFETMSLAGTQIAYSKEKTTWKKKELVEQQLVTNFIELQLKPLCSSLKIYKKETIKAGNLFHLKSRINGVLSDRKSGVSKLIKALHPNPAICGLPINLAKKFILEKELYHRSFYTGFLGELNLFNHKQKEYSHLFVNLRCMEMVRNKAFIYVGGGITAQSEAQKEWEETNSKGGIMKSVLK